jgi:hypothetical protein
MLRNSRACNGLAPNRECSGRYANELQEGPSCPRCKALFKGTESIACMKAARRFDEVEGEVEEDLIFVD